MKEYQVVVRRSIECTVPIIAHSSDQAAEIVSKASFELPPRDEWEGIKDWFYAVYDDSGDLILEMG